METLLNEKEQEKATLRPRDTLHMVEESETQDDASHEEVPTAT